MKFMSAGAASAILLFISCPPVHGQKAPVTRAKYSNAVMSVPIPAGFIPVSENREFVSALLAEAKAPGAIVKDILSAPPKGGEKFIDKENLTLIIYHGRNFGGDCKPVAAAFIKSARGLKPAAVRLGKLDWLRIYDKERSTVRYMNCSEDAIRTASYLDPAAVVPDLLKFSAANVAAIKH